METWSGGRRLRLKRLLTVPLWILGLVGAYFLAGPIDRALSGLPATVEVLVFVAAGACVAACWYLARDRDEQAQPAAPAVQARDTAPAAVPEVAPAAAPPPPAATVGRAPFEGVSLHRTNGTAVVDDDEVRDSTVSTAPAPPAHALADACHAFERSASDVARVLGQLADTCLLLADRIDDNRRHNQALGELLLRVDSEGRRFDQ